VGDSPTFRDGLVAITGTALAGRLTMALGAVFFENMVGTLIIRLLFAGNVC
jgi:hypothetical protein